MTSMKIGILIVDDIADTRANLRRLLQLTTDIEVVGEAENGQEALDCARRLLPDIILMDINMPVMDGIEATERLALELPESAVIMLSVQGEPEYIRKAVNAGAYGYLFKPPSSEDLFAAIHEVYGLKQKGLKKRYD